MKKQLLVLLLCFISILGFGQEIKIISDKFPLYQGIVTSNLPAKSVYSQGKLWVAESFKSAKDVIQYDNEDEATIIVNGNTNIGSGFKQAKIHFTFKIEAREGRFRYTLEITDITGVAGQGLAQSVMALYLKNAKYGDWVTEEMSPILKYWINSILKTQTNSSDEDW